jgi:hypothetical protein
MVTSDLLPLGLITDIRHQNLDEPDMIMTKFRDKSGAAD